MEVRQLSGFGYQRLPHWEILQILFVDLAPGGSDDWIYDLGIKYSFTIELRDKGKYGFLLPERYIRPMCSEALAAVAKIASHVIRNV